MVTVCTCYTLPEAQVIQSQLEGSGIEAFLPDELTVQNYWLWSNAIGGVRVQVQEEDAKRATEVLEESSGANQEESAKSCPHCGVPMQELYGFRPYPKMLLALLFSIPIRSKPIWRCPKCGIVRNS
jgi:Putative prokaryotic signal transducing protein